MTKVLVSHRAQRHFPTEILSESCEPLFFFDGLGDFAYKSLDDGHTYIEFGGTPVLKDGKPALPQSVRIQKSGTIIVPSFIMKEDKLTQISDIGFFFPFVTIDAYDKQISFLQFIESHNIACAESSSAFIACMNKIQTYDIFQQNDIPYPASYPVTSEEMGDNIQQLLAFYQACNGKVILKTSRSRVGLGIEIPKNVSDFIEKVKDFIDNRAEFIIQKLVPIEGRKHHIRVASSYGSIIAAQKFIAQDGYETSHVGQHQNVEEVPLSDKQADICLKAARTLGVNNCSLDCLISKTGEFYILEANILPAVNELFPEQSEIMVRNIMKQIGAR